MKIEQTLAKYAGSKQPNTEKRLARCYNALSEFVGGKCFGKVTREDAVDFFLSLKKQGLSDATVQNTYSLLSGAYRMLTEIGTLKVNPISAARSFINHRQKRRVRPTEFIEFMRVARILTSIKLNAGTIRGRRLAVRDRTMIAILFGCGLRRSEAQALNVNSIHVCKDGLMFVKIEHSKSGKSRRVALNPWTWQFLSHYVSQRKTDRCYASDPLFVNYDQEGRAMDRISESTLYRAYRRVTGAAPHSARKTYATKLIRDGATRKQVAAELGHASEMMVGIYEAETMIEQSPGRNLAF